MRACLVQTGPVLTNHWFGKLKTLAFVSCCDGTLAAGVKLNLGLV